MVSAVIVNYKNAELTTASVKSFQNSANELGIDFEVTVVDNSASETAWELKERLGNSINLLTPEKNLGFSKANNLGVQKTHGEFLFLVNNDAFVTSRMVERAIEVLETDFNVGLYAPSLVYEDGRHQRSTGTFPNLMTIFAEYLLPYRIAQKWTGVDENLSSYVPTVSGACMVLRKDFFLQLGGFDEEFFFTSEDVDLCRRINDCGKKVFYDRDTSVIHFSGKSQSWNWIRDPYLHRGRILYIRKYYGLFSSILVKGIIGLGLALRRLRNRK